MYNCQRQAQFSGLCTYRRDHIQCFISFFRLEIPNPWSQKVSSKYGIVEDSNHLSFPSFLKIRRIWNVATFFFKFPAISKNYNSKNPWINHNLFCKKNSVAFNRLIVAHQYKVDCSSEFPRTKLEITVTSSLILAICAVKDPYTYAGERSFQNMRV